MKEETILMPFVSSKTFHMHFIGFLLHKLVHAIHTEIFKVLKMKNFNRKYLIFFLFFGQNIDCEYTQHMFWRKVKKNRYTPANPILDL